MPGPVRLAYPPRSPPRRRSQPRRVLRPPHRTADRWDDGFLAGRDLLAGGTWMGIADSLRFAAVTNVRNGAPSTGARSRGALPVDYLRGRLSPADYAAQVAATGAEYGSFNLLVGDPAELWWATNRPHGRRQRVEPGVHGLSNAELDTPWPKVTGGKAGVRRCTRRRRRQPRCGSGGILRRARRQRPRTVGGATRHGHRTRTRTRPVVPVHSLRRLRDAGVDTAAGPAGRHLRHHRTTVRRERPHRRGPLPARE